MAFPKDFLIAVDAVEWRISEVGKQEEDFMKALARMAGDCRPMKPGKRAYELVLEARSVLDARLVIYVVRMKGVSESTNVVQVFNTLQDGWKRKKMSWSASDLSLVIGSGKYEETVSLSIQGKPSTFAIERMGIRAEWGVRWHPVSSLREGLERNSYREEIIGLAGKHFPRFGFGGGGVGGG